MNRWLTWMVALAVILCAAQAWAQVVRPCYRLVDLGTLGGTESQAAAINNLGQVVGESRNANGDTHAYIWCNGRMFDLGTLGGNESGALAINDAGAVVGAARTAANEDHPFIWFLGRMFDLGTLGGTYGEAHGVNNFFQVVGESNNANGDLRAFLVCFNPLFRRVTFRRDLGTFGGDTSNATGINDLGIIVGEADTPDFSTQTNEAIDHAFIWKDGCMKDLGTLPGALTSGAYAINCFGLVAGESDTTVDLNPGEKMDAGVFWQFGRICALPPLNSDEFEAFALNKWGVIVGGTDGTLRQQQQDAPIVITPDRAFVFDRIHGIRDLNDLIPPSPGWQLEAAKGINDKGWIVGNATLNGNDRGFLLIPIE